MKKLNENMMRKHNWDQLQNIQKKINIYQECKKFIDELILIKT